MTTDTVIVVLEGQPIGEVERLERGALRLRFDETYRADADATLLSLSMPPSTDSHGDARITPWLWGLLPDNGDVLARWGRDFGVSTATPFPLLATQVGHDCAGAVQFCAPDELDRLLARSGDMTTLTTADIAERLRNLRADSTSWLGPGFTGQFSLGGAQAKTALHRTGDGWAVPSGSAPTTHILKPAVSGFEAQDVNEHLCLSAARALGLRAATTSIAAFENETAVVVERFDRARHAGDLIRVHQEDLCQALSIPPSRKYQAERGPAPGQIAELLRTSIPGPEAETDVWRFADALVFNWLILGTDAHAKNYSLLLAGAQVRLAPLYDVSSYLPYDDSNGYAVKLAMKVGDDYKLRRTDRQSAWLHAAAELRVDPDRLLERIVDLAERTPDAFAAVAAEPAVTGLGTDMPQRLVDLVAQRCRHCITVVS